MRWFEGYLKVDGWSSGCRSVQRLLDHLARKTKSESSRRHHLEIVALAGSVTSLRIAEAGAK